TGPIRATSSTLPAKPGTRAVATIPGSSSRSTSAPARPRNSGTGSGTRRRGGPRVATAERAPGDQSRTKSAYALQWNRFRIIRPDEDRATFRNRTGLTESDLAGAWVLDAGCGMGRYLRVAAECGARVVGLDLSEALIAARELTADLPVVGLVRG